MAWVDLHCRSAFSFLRGATTPEALATGAGRLQIPAIALCDRDGFYGSVRLHTSGQEQGVRAIVGAELTMNDGTIVPVLVQTREAYRSLCRLITTAKLRAPKGEGSITWDELAESSGGLHALTGDEEGPVVSSWRKQGKGGATDGFEKLFRIFGRDRLWVELQRHMIRGEEQRNKMLIDLSSSSGCRILATNGVIQAAPSDRTIADVFTCLRHSTTLDGAGTLLSQNRERYLKPESAMNALFRDLPSAVYNTNILSEQLEFSLHDLGYSFPSYPVPEGECMDSFLRKLAWFGAQQRYGSLAPKVRKQIEHELTVIAQLGFAGYFLTVWDICNFCREKGILVQGRGSAANSAVCYSLGITAVDPVGGQLLFERFLSEGRHSWPDIDLDLPSGDRRESVIQEVYRKFGHRGAAMTANVITYRGRSTIRELGKVLSLPEETIDQFSKLYANGDFPETLELRNQLKMAGMPSNHPRLPALVALYQRMQGLPRHLGQHSGGMVICQGRLDCVVPLENASMPGRSVIQWDKDDCKDLGIIKVDLLGLGMMAAIQDTLEICQARGRPVDLARIPKDDPETFSLMQKADTIGVFQIESRAQMATLPRMKPKTFYDVAIEVAIIRPGPIQGDAVNPYLERRAGRQEVTYDDDRLRPILDRTLGIVLFQEQVLRIAMELAGFTAGEADELRRAIDFKRSPERMRRSQKKLDEGLAANGVPERARVSIIKSLSSFALYGFPESHALSFALLAYASSYLKVHRPVEFYAGLLNNQPMGFYSPATLLQDARRHGVTAKPVCVVKSDWLTTVETNDTLRLGLRCIKGLSESRAHELIACRMQRPFSSMKDFLQRTNFSAEERRKLAAAGALNALAEHRRKALWQVEGALDSGDLFSGIEDASEALSPLETMTHLERLAADYRVTSLTVGSHPMRALRDGLPGILRASDLVDQPNGSIVTVAGSVICRQRPGTAKGFVFISLEDETGVSNSVVRPQLFEKERLVITQEPSLIVRGRLQIHDGVVHVRAETIEALRLSDLPAQASHDFH